MGIFFWVAVAQAAGPIEDATPLTVVLMNMLQFLLSVAGIVAILGIVVSGVWYLMAGGDVKRVRLAKNAMLFSIIGTVIVLGALVVLRQIGNWFA